MSACTCLPFQEKMSQKLSSMREARAEMEARIRTVEEERDLLKEELGQSKLATGTAKNEMEVMKDVALQQTTLTYEKSMQLQKHLLELQVGPLTGVYYYCVNQILILQTEKSLIEKQRDIALKERERMVTEAISLKKKLETIKVTQ